MMINTLLWGALEIAVDFENEIVGICFFDKYCYTNVFGFEILKDE